MDMKSVTGVVFLLVTFLILDIPTSLNLLCFLLDFAELALLVVLR